MQGNKLGWLDIIIYIMQLNDVVSKGLVSTRSWNSFLVSNR